jgi:hypothetical protein
MDKCGIFRLLEILEALQLVKLGQVRHLKFMPILAEVEQELKQPLLVVEDMLVHQTRHLGQVIQLVNMTVLLGVYIQQL